MEELKESTKKEPSLVFHGEVILSRKTQSMFLQIQLLLALQKKKKTPSRSHNAGTVSFLKKVS